MSKYIISIFFLLSISINQNTAQIEVIEENKVVIGPKNFADPSAKLEVNSVESPTDLMNIPRGMLLPRMSFAQMNAIADTRDALMVFVNDDDIEIRGYYYYDGKPKEWVRIPSNNCRACTDQFIGDSNGNGIPDKIIPYDCGVDCGVVGNNINIISISTDFSDLCEVDLEYNTYEIFVDDVSVTGILPLDDAGEICYESETINESEVRIVLYSDCCCETIEFITFPSCDFCAETELNFYSDGPAALSFDELIYEGNIVENYLIRWVDENGDVIFKSAAGSYYDMDNTFSHPSSEIPITGFIKPIIEASDIIGLELDCFDSLDIESITCYNGYTQSYSGPGNVPIHFDIGIDPQNPVIKFYFNYFTVVDIFEIHYNDELIYTNNGQLFRYPAIEIPYIDGIEFINVIIYNSDPFLNTEWDLTVLDCCEELTCLPEVGDHRINSIVQDECNFRFDFVSDYECQDVNLQESCTGFVSSTYNNISTIYLGQVPIWSTNIITGLSGCYDGALVLDRINQKYTLTFSELTDYNLLKTYIEDPYWAENPSHFCNLYFTSNECDNDFSYSNSISVFPSYTIIEFLESELTVTIDYNVENPFEEVCDESVYRYYSRFQYELDRSDIEETEFNSFRLSYANSYTTINNLEGLRSRIIKTHCGNTVFRYNLIASDPDDIPNSWKLYRQDTNGDYTILVQEAGDPLGCLSQNKLINENSFSSNKMLERDYFSYPLYLSQKNSRVRVYFYSELDQDIELELFDGTGKKIETTSSMLFEGLNNYDFSLEGYKKGKYDISYRLGGSRILQKLQFEYY